MKFIKFKIMNDSKGAKGDLFPDAVCLKIIVTLVPRLVKALKRDMSLIGPSFRN